MGMATTEPTHERNHEARLDSHQASGVARAKSTRVVTQASCRLSPMAASVLESKKTSGMVELFCGVVTKGVDHGLDVLAFEKLHKLKGR